MKKKSEHTNNEDNEVLKSAVRKLTVEFIDLSLGFPEFSEFQCANRRFNEVRTDGRTDEAESSNSGRPPPKTAGGSCVSRLPHVGNSFFLGKLSFVGLCT